MFTKLADASRSFRHRYGGWRGSLLWLELLKEKLVRPGTPFAVHVPGHRYPVFLRAHSSDIECFCQIFIHGELDIPFPDAVGYVIDAGANIGLSSVYLAERFPSAKIDSLEVDSGNVELLRRNVRGYRNVTVLAKGLWDRSCRLKILNPEAEPWAFRVGETTADDPAGFAAVGVADLLSARQANRVDILKVDIEGAEKEVFEASGAWIGRVDTLLVELHDRFKSGCSLAVDQACSTRPHGRSLSGEYHVFRFEDRRPTAQDSQLRSPIGATVS